MISKPLLWQPLDTFQNQEGQEGKNPLQQKQKSISTATSVPGERQAEHRSCVSTARGRSVPAIMSQCALTATCNEPLCKKRRPNFSKEELLTLISAVRERWDVIAAPVTPHLTGSMKEEAWKAVTAEVNIVSHFVRNITEIRSKFADFKSITKKKIGQLHREQTSTVHSHHLAGPDLLLVVVSHLWQSSPLTFYIMATLGGSESISNSGGTSIKANELKVKREYKNKK
ncbi:hypothetical protein O3P69_004173 [Scylla paramamosain]|uniref:Regulatory protein zeste n=1 Tax=Scylla paramamosain TaxID=85552 RepID=A0AAW0UHB2_SCYPA